MIYGSDIVTKLNETDAIVDIVSDRIYPEYIREADKVYPLIVYKKENVVAEQSYDGPTSLQSADVIIACISSNHDEAEYLAEVVLSALDGDTSAWGTTWIQGCFLKEDGINERIFTQETNEDLTLYV